MKYPEIKLTTVYYWHKELKELTYYSKYMADFGADHKLLTGKFQFKVE